MQGEEDQQRVLHKEVGRHFMGALSKRTSFVTAGVEDDREDFPGGVVMFTFPGDYELNVYR